MQGTFGHVKRIVAGCGLLGLLSTVAWADPPVNHDLLLWLRSDRGVVQDGQGGVAEWQDQALSVGGANDALQPAQGARPIVIPAASPRQNGPALRFASVPPPPLEDYLDIGPDAAFDTNRLSWFVVFKTNNFNGTLIRAGYSSAVEGTITSTQLSTAWGTITSTQDGGSFRAHARSADGTFQPVNAVVGNNNLGQFLVGSVVWDGTEVVDANTTGTVRAYLTDAGGITTSALTVAGGANLRPTGHRFTRIGAGDDPVSRFFSGDIAEVLVYTDALADADRMAVEQYLYTKWFTSNAASLTVTANLLVHLAADMGIATDAAGRVEVWHDQAAALGGANDALQATPTQRPGLVVNASPLGDKPVLRFSSRSEKADWLEIGGDAQLDTNTLTWFVAGRANALSGWFLRSAYADRGDGNQELRMWGSLLSSADGGSYNSLVRSMTGTGVTSQSILGAQGLGQFLVGSSVWDGGTSSITQWLTDSAGVTTLANVNGVGADAIPTGHLATFIGADTGNYPEAGTHLDGDLGEILIFNRVLPDADRQAIEQYLHDRWFTTANPAVPISDGLILWLKADAGVTADAQNLVTRWGDQATGDGVQDAVQNELLAAPLFVPSASPGGDKPILRFGWMPVDPDAPLSDYLEIGTNAAFDHETFTSFVVFRPDQLSSVQSLLRSAYLANGTDTNTERLNNLWGSYLNGGDFVGHARAIDGASFIDAALGLAPVAGEVTTEFFLGTMEWDAADDVRVTLTNMYGESASGIHLPMGLASATPTGHRYTRIGAGSESNSAPRDFFSGDVLEILVYNTALGDLERQAVQDYLINEWFYTVGACCLAPDTCVVLTPAECAAANGSFRGIGTTCATTNCNCGTPKVDVDFDGDVDQLDFGRFQACYGFMLSGSILGTGGPQVLINGGFESVPFPAPWTATRLNVATPHPGLTAGSLTAARVDPAVGGTVTERLFRQTFGALGSEWTFEVDFAMPDPGTDTVRAFNVNLRHHETSAWQISLRVNGDGAMQCYNGSSWVAVSGAGAVAFSVDANADGDFADPVDTLNVHHLRIVGRDYGTASARYDVSLSYANSTTEAVSVTDLAFWQGTAPTTATRQLREVLFATIDAPYVIDNVSLRNGIVTGGARDRLCACFDLPMPDGTTDGVINSADLQRFIECVSGPTVIANPACDD